MPTPFGAPAPKDNDDEFLVDLSEAPTGGGYLIPDGDYPAVLVRPAEGVQQEWESSVGLDVRHHERRACW